MNHTKTLLQTTSRRLLNAMVALRTSGIEKVTTGRVAQLIRVIIFKRSGHSVASSKNSNAFQGYHPAKRATCPEKETREKLP